MTPELRPLHDEFPLWTFGTVWTAAASGPDYRCVWASRNGVLLSDRTAAGLRQKIVSTERDEHWPRDIPPVRQSANTERGNRHEDS